MHFRKFEPSAPVPDAVVVKLYKSGDEVRGYVRKIADRREEDTIFPGEEMKPEAAFRLAATHSQRQAPIYVELLEGVEWDPLWGSLTS